MASLKTSFCSDEELLNELKKLGYNDIPPDVFQLMKNDLSELIEKDTYLSENDQKGKKQQIFSPAVRSRNAEKKCVGTLQRAEKLKAESFTNAEINSNLQDAGNSPQNSVENRFREYRNRLKRLETSSFQRQQIDRMKPDFDSHKSSGATSSVSFARNYAYTSNNFERLPTTFPKILEKRTSEEIDRNQKVSNSSFNQVDDVLNDYRDRFENLKISSFESKRESDSSSSTDMKSKMTDSSLSITGNKIKRKILRHIDGKPVISEVFLDRPRNFNTSYPETDTFESNKSFSSTDLSWKYNNSTVSVLSSSPDFVTRSSSTYSLSTPRSLQSHLVSRRKKKNDPVTMYNYYKKYWNNFKPPGEKTHDKLRWAVRDRMLDYNL